MDGQMDDEWTDRQTIILQCELMLSHTIRPRAMQKTVSQGRPGLALGFGTISDPGFLDSRCSDSTFFSGVRWSFWKPQALQ